MPKNEDIRPVKTWVLGDEVEIIARDRFTNDKREVLQSQLEYPDWVARLATLMVEKWGTVAAEPDGEDSSGRAKVRLATADELVTRAVDVAEALVAKLRERGHVYKTPTYAEQNATDDDEIPG